MGNDDRLGKPATWKKAVFVFAIGVTAALSCPAQTALAQSESIAATAQATVKNAFTVSETVAPSSGSVALMADTLGTDAATVTIAPDGTVTVQQNGDANAIVVDDSAANAAEFQISDAAPNAAVNIAFANINDLVCGVCSNPSNPVIELGGLNHDAGGSPMTDGTGNLTFHVGFTLTTVAGGDPYQDGTYNGSFDVEISY